MAGYYRKYAQQKANQWWGANPLFLDTETTGLGPDAEIIEICIIGNDGEILLDTLIHPSRKIPLDATRIHGITDEQVDKAPSWLYLWPRLKEIITGRIIGIYNADFDLRMLQQTNKRSGIFTAFPALQIFCIMKLYSEFSGQNSYQSLEKACIQCGIPVRSTHRALDDSILAMALFRYIVQSS